MAQGKEYKPDDKDLAYTHPTQGKGVPVDSLKSMSELEAPSGKWVLYDDDTIVTAPTTAIPTKIGKIGEELPADVEGLIWRYVRG